MGVSKTSNYMINNPRKRKKQRERAKRKIKNLRRKMTQRMKRKKKKVTKRLKLLLRQSIKLTTTLP
jgi:hypothetical protein